MTKQKILITGAGSGIGLACVQRFLKEGWSVVAHFHQSIHELKKIQKTVGDHRLTLVQCNFKKAPEVQKFLKFIKKFKCEALINNAALYDVSHSKKNRIAAAEDIMRVNLITPTLLAETVLEGMKKMRKGYVINISSLGAKYGSSLQNVFYGMSKRGLEALTLSLAREGASYHVLVNTVRPGMTDTKFHQNTGKDIDKRKKMIPLKRLARPEEIADFIYFLCSQNTFITRETLGIAGGE